MLGGFRKRKRLSGHIVPSLGTHPSTPNLSHGDKRLTRLTYPKKDENHLAHPDFQDAAYSDVDQTQYLKRLLVTVKQHYEKSLQQLQIQLQAEQNQRIALQNEREKLYQRIL